MGQTEHTRNRARTARYEASATPASHKQHDFFYLLLLMPEISRFLGIIIRMFYNEHNPPHFHAYYNDYKAEISIESFDILAGDLPKRVYKLVVEWAIDHKEELRKDWEHLRNDMPPEPIEPLT
jgi:Domain of unknown function (DUF4160)